MSMSEQMIPAPPPKTELERYRILSSTAGVKVSPLCLGAMSLGEAWKNDMGSLNKEKSFELLDAFYNAGGNFIDTANNYQNEESERFIGEWMETRQNRDEMVIATKFTTNYRMHEIGKGGRVINFTGNSRKSIHMSVDASLRKLRTSYIDVLYLHYWDWTAGVKEIMDSLHILIEQGKVLYLGISNAPAWVVAEANTYATAHGKTPFSVYQGRWNLLQRSFEREILPMAQRFGMALCPWDVLGSGKFQSRAQLDARAAQGESLRKTIGNAYAWTKDRTPEEERISDSLEEVAKQLGGGATVQQVAIAWIMQKTPNVFPLLGGRKVEHLHDNIKALSLRLTKDQIRYLESVNDFDFGYPTNMIGPDPRESGGSSMIMSISAHVDFVKAAKAIGLE